MLTPEEITRLAADEPQPREGESMQDYSTRYGEWYGRVFAFSFPKKGTVPVVPVTTIHTKKVA